MVSSAGNISVFQSSLCKRVSGDAYVVFKMYSHEFVPSFYLFSWLSLGEPQLVVLLDTPKMCWVLPSLLIIVRLCLAPGTRPSSFGTPWVSANTPFRFETPNLMYSRLTSEIDWSLLEFFFKKCLSFWPDCSEIWNFMCACRMRATLSGCPVCGFLLTAATLSSSPVAGTRWSR